MSFHDLKVNDIVCLITLGVPAVPVRIIRETKQYYIVDLTTLPEEHPCRCTEKGILKEQYFRKQEGLQKGTLNLLDYCPEYITELEDIIKDLEQQKKDLEQQTNRHLWEEEDLQDITKQLKYLNRALKENKLPSKEELPRII